MSETSISSGKCSPFRSVLLLFPAAQCDILLNVESTLLESVFFGKLNFLFGQSITMEARKAYIFANCSFD